MEALTIILAFIVGIVVGAVALDWRSRRQALAELGFYWWWLVIGVIELIAEMLA